MKALAPQVIHLVLAFWVMVVSYFLVDSIADAVADERTAFLTIAPIVLFAMSAMLFLIDVLNALGKWDTFFDIKNRLSVSAFLLLLIGLFVYMRWM